MVTALPTNIGYGTVVGRFLAVVADGPDADNAPDGVALAGTVVFTPSVSVALVASVAPTTLALTPIKASLDGEGYLFQNGSRGVTLLATDSTAVNPLDFTYRVSFEGLTVNDQPFQMAGYHIKVPAGVETDLTKVTPVSYSEGLLIIRGEQGPPGDGTGGGGSGTDGKSVEMRNNGTYIQWRLVGTSTWINLVALADITGPKGDPGTGGGGGSGTDGRSVEIQTTSTEIQWRLIGDTTWKTIVTLASLKGQTGSTGPQGPAGNVRLMPAGATAAPTDAPAGTIIAYRA